MKKKIIMTGILLISSLSLLLVIFCVKTKDIKYINSNEINKYGITMLLETEEGQTNITEVPTEGNYKIEYTCENNSAVINWSNISHKIKIKVTDSPVKCTLAFVEVTEDINMVAMYVNGTTSEYEVEELTNGTNYYLNSYTCKNANGLDITSDITVSFNNATRKTEITPVTKKVYCNLYFTTTEPVYNYGTIANAINANKRPTYYNEKLYINGIPHVPSMYTAQNQTVVYNGNLYFGHNLTNGISTFGPSVATNRFTPVSGVNTRTVSIAANRTVLIYPTTSTTANGGQKFYNLKISTNGTTYYNLSEAVTNGIIRPIVLISHQAIDFIWGTTYFGNTGDNTKLLNIYDTSDEIIAKYYYQLSIYFMTIEPITKIQFTTEADWSTGNLVEITDVPTDTFRLTLNPY